MALQSDWTIVQPEQIVEAVQKMVAPVGVEKAAMTLKKRKLIASSPADHGACKKQRGLTDPCLVIAAITVIVKIPALWIRSGRRSCRLFR